MATRSKRPDSSPEWPFDDPAQQDLMAPAFAGAAGVDLTGPFGLSLPQQSTSADWVTDPGWVTDPKWATNPSSAARYSARPSGVPLVRSGGRRYLTVALGYHPDLPDVRDLMYRHLQADAAEKEGPRKDARALMAKQLAPVKQPAQAPERVNSIPWCSPIEDQGSLGSCTAQAVVSLIEYMQRRSGNEHVDGSRLFVYKVARKLQGWTGDTGCYLRTTLKAVAAFGVPPEPYWPYLIDRYEDEPSAFLYSFAANYQAVAYARLDPPGQLPAQTLSAVKQTLAKGLGVVFGFPVYSSITTAADIPFPTEKDKVLGGHAVMAVGYDDQHGDGGALIIRNSWGSGWGRGGYGFLPYGYVEQGLAQDFWTISKTEWLDLQPFG